MMSDVTVCAPPLQRHDWVHLSEAGWQKLMHTLADDAAHLQAWREADWPLVVRRQDADVLHDQNLVCAGIALPRSPATPAQKGRRISVRVSLADVRTMRAPLALDDALPSAPAIWQSALSKLLQSAAAHGLKLQVYGSLAFQTITGLPYIDAQSDIDLILRVNSKAQLTAGVELFAQFSDALPLDGEIIFPNGAAVAWKEWRQVQQQETSAQTRVLVKDKTQVRLLPLAALLHDLN